MFKASSSPQFGLSPEAADAVASDPNAIGLMQGFPPEPDKRVVFATRTALTFPKLRWSVNHWREIAPTRRVWRGTGPIEPFVRDVRDLSAIRFKTLDGMDVDFQSALSLMYTDGLLVLHRGQIAFETYRAGGAPHLPHSVFSITKSVTGLLACVLIVEGKLDPEAQVTHYLPELEGSGFEGAAVRNVLDMTVGAKFSENYPDPDAEIRQYGAPSGMGPITTDYAGPSHLAAYLPTIRPAKPHGQMFQYITPATEVIRWILTRLTGQTLSDLLSNLVWTKLGVEEDASINLDAVGADVAGTGLSVTLRDLGRFGEMIRNGGRIGSRRIIPTEAIAEMIRPGTEQEKQAFAKAAYPHLVGWSYRNQWWLKNDSHGAFQARGIFGQVLHIDPAAEIVIVRQSSMPTASSTLSDPLCLPFYDAVTEFLST
ncbi:serine hydrolase [Bradyrhizobium sp. CIR3A]|uniref:serine hydrolase domain-containing protein n=1 Tax=Bradyrhizobium sp. CIR3A TaxID=2663838 RepID=UPI001606C4FA|nr:serine hydrolase [Bradyrhizobium sp. CIR3A]MBB4261348.1 hypothetical protein [Bradyrhizobium sp. CIR3A]